MAKKIISPTGKAKTLAPVHPNQGTEAEYRRKLDRLIAEMNRSLVYWLSAAYRRTPPEMAQDAPDASGGFVGQQVGSPARLLNRVVGRLAGRWQRRFDEAAPELASWFATNATDRSDAALKATLKKAGMTVEFKMTAEANDAYQAVLAENVGLIKSIASEHLTQVQGLVMRSVAQGRDLGPLAKELEERYGVTKRRAAFIARDQNNKATAVITRVRQTELGITTATWQHSGGGRHPRPLHVAASGKEYDVSKGMLIDGKWIFPGQEPNCRCVSRSVIPGF